VHPTPEARAFFAFAIFSIKRRFCQVLIASGAGDQHVPGGCAAWNRGADYVSTAIGQ